MAWLQIGLLVASVALKFLVKQRVKRPGAPDLDIPKVEEGVPIPAVYGTQAVSPIFNAVKPIKQEKNDDEGVTLYHFLATGDLCLGEITEVVDIQFGGKSLRLHPITRRDSISESETRYAVTVDGAPTEPGLPYAFGAENFVLFDVNGRMLFGGPEKEGGVERHLRVHKGSLTGVADPVTTRLWQAAGLPGDGPGYPGCAYASFGEEDDTAFYVGTIAQPKTPVFIIRVIPNTLGFGSIGINANPAEIIYDLLTHPLRGRGINPNLIDTESFVDCGRRLVEEKLGLSLTINTQRELQDIIEDIGRHIHGDCYQSALTGKWTMVLARDDYEVDELEEINRGRASDLRVTFPSWQRTTNEIKINYRQYDETPLLTALEEEEHDLHWSFDNAFVFVKGKNISNVTVFNVTQNLTVGTDYYSFNPRSGVFIFPDILDGIVENGDTVRITYTNGSEAVGFKEATEPAQDLANQQATREIRAETLQRPFFTNQLDASVHAKRELRLRSRVLAEATWSEDRTANGYARKPGDVVAVTWTPEDVLEGDFSLDRVPFRILEVDYGENPGSPVRVKAVQDVFGASFMPTDSGGDGGPSIIAGTSPGMAIGCGLGGANVRIAFFPSDTNFNIRLWVADDANGTNRALVDTFIGTTLNYDTAMTGRYYQAQLVRPNFEDGPLTPWITCIPTGPPTEPDCELPTVLALEDATAFSLALTFTDKQNRITGFRYTTRVGDVSETTEVEMPAAGWNGYTTTITVTADDTGSEIAWEVDYQACDGSEAQFTGTSLFTLPDPDPEPEPDGGLDTSIFEIALHADAVLALGALEVPLTPTALTVSRATEDKVPLEETRAARITASVKSTNLPVGAYVAIQFEAAGAPGLWNYLDDDDGPNLALDEASLVARDEGAATAGPWVVSGEWTSLSDHAWDDVRVRAVVFGGDGSELKSIIITRLAVQFRQTGARGTDPEPPIDPPDPGSCTEPAPLDSGLNNYANEAALDASWAETNSSPAQNTWTVSPGIIVLDMTGSGTGPVIRTKTFGGFNPDDVATFYLLVTASDTGVDAFLEAEGVDTDAATATSTSAVLLSVTVQPTTDGEVTLRWGVSDSAGGGASAGSDALNYATQAAAEAAGWVFASDGGSITVDTGRDIGAFTTSTRITAGGPGSDPALSRTFTVVNGASYTIRVQAASGPAMPWFVEGSINGVSGSNVGSDQINGGEADQELSFTITASGTSLTISFTTRAFFGNGDFYVAGLVIEGLGSSETVQFDELGFCEGSGIPADPTDPVDPDPGPNPPPLTPVGERMFGAHNTPIEGLSYWSSTIANLNTVNKTKSVIDAARAAGTRHFGEPAGTGGQWTDGSGKFRYDLWKAQIDEIANHPIAGPALEAAIADGTIPVHYIIDEPNRLDRWGGAVPWTTVERMCQYSKQVWPTWVTCVRIAPNVPWFTEVGRHMNGLDLLWAEYHLRKGTPTNFGQECYALANLYGHGCVLGIHWHHYAGASGDSNRNITADEVRVHGRQLIGTGAQASFWYALMGWRYVSSLFDDPNFEIELGSLMNHFASFDP